MKHVKASQITAKPAPENYFTGTVWLEVLQSDLVEVQVARVTFEPSARTAWHTHPKGQTLLITSGNGLFQKRGEAVQTMQHGDVLVIPADIEHWHGASPNSLMQHLAIQTQVNGVAANWLEQVSDSDYLSLEQLG